MRSSTILLVLLCAALSACGGRHPGDPQAPETLDITFEWTTERVAGWTVEPPRRVMTPVREWRAEFRPDHTFRYAWRDPGDDAWESIVGSWREPDGEPWADGYRQFGRTWILEPENAPTHVEPDGFGCDRPLVRWARRTGPEGAGPTRPMWWIAAVDPDARRFTGAYTMQSDLRR